MDADGTGLRKMTHNKLDDIHPDWSPDGSRIIFVHDPNPVSTSDSDLRVLEVDSGREYVFPYDDRGGGEDYPAWSPDGEWIAFESGDYDGSNLVIASVDGKRSRVDAPWVEEDSVNFDPSWAPDSRSGVYIEAAYGTPTTRIWGDSYGFRSRKFKGAVNNPVWSPDGEEILLSVGAFRAYDNDLSDTDSDLYTVSPGGNAPERLEEDEPCATQPGSWSPEGEQIVFYSDRAGSFDIYTMDADGSAVRRLTTHPSADINPDWGP